MNTANRLSISAMAFLIGLGAMPALAQTVNDNTTGANFSGNASGNNMSGNVKNNLSGSASNSASLEQTMVNGDISAESTIEADLKSGKLTPADASRLEQGQARIDQSESTALNNGRLSNSEAAQIQKAENTEDARITKLDNSTANPDMVVSNDVAADLQRNVNQETRIDQGIANGSLTGKEVGQLEQGQSQVDGLEAQDTRSDYISTTQQRQIQADENVQSTDIRDDRHNSMTVGQNTTGNDPGRMNQRRSWADGRDDNRHDMNVASEDGQDFRHDRDGMNRGDGRDDHRNNGQGQDKMTVAYNQSSNDQVQGRSGSNVIVSGSTKSSTNVSAQQHVTPHHAPPPPPHVAPAHK